MHLFNSLTGRVDPFEPLTQGEIKMYVCGLTVSDDAHLGHGRAAALFDLLRRIFLYKGMSVLYVRNITDVDEKIILRAKETGMDPQNMVEKYMARHAQDMERLRVPRADIEPRASEHIPEMIEFIEQLIQKKAAYEKDGNVYFATRAFSEFGKLAKRAGKEIDKSDFLLWKNVDPSEPGWHSPWSLGRPGWHIECSAMSMEFLGETFDIHGGGDDLLHPHHDCEIAQSQALSNKPFANFFMHNALVYLAEEKMSKSKGNFFTLREIFDQYDPAVVRYFLFSTHYRQPLRFEPGMMDPARRSIEKMETFLSGAREIISPPVGGPNESARVLAELVSRGRARVLTALDDDIDVPIALRVMEDIVAAGDEHLQSGEPDPLVLGKVEEFLEEMDEMFDLRRERTRTQTRRGELVEALLKVRKKLGDSNDDKSTQAGEEIKKALESVGVEVIDTRWGTRWKWE